jgi:hypothetical protein
MIDTPLVEMVSIYPSLFDFVPQKSQAGFPKFD